MTSLTLTTAPTIEPLIVADLMAHLRLDTADEFFLLETQIVAARRHVEIYTGSAILTQTWLWQLDAVPVDIFVELPRGPVQSIASVQYLDTAGSLQTMSAADYQLLAPQDPNGGRHVLALNYSKSWPTARDDFNAFRVSFVAGYVDRKSVPQEILAAILLIAGDLFENREAQTLRDAFNPNPTVTNLLAPYRRGWFG